MKISNKLSHFFGIGMIGLIIIGTFIFFANRADAKDYVDDEFVDHATVHLNQQNQVDLQTFLTAMKIAEIPQVTKLKLIEPEKLADLTVGIHYVKVKFTVNFTNDFEKTVKLTVRPYNGTPEFSVHQTDEHSVIKFHDQTIPFVQANGATTAPKSDAATWVGDGSVTDDRPTHFIGHNPGDFKGVLDLYVGDAITVIDDQGKSRTYHVYEVVNVTDFGINSIKEQDNVLPRMLQQSGERISLQTCIGETVNRCILAQ